MSERVGIESEFLGHHFEGAKLATMAPVHVFDIKRDCTEVLRDGFDFGGGHKEKNGGRVDKTADQPRARDPIDLRPRARDPDRAAFRIAAWNLGGGNERKIFLRPALDASVEDSCGCASVTKPRSNTFTDCLPLLADHDDRLSGKARRPFRDIDMT